MYLSRSMMTVPDPLSAGFMIMSVCECYCLRAIRSCLERLSRTLLRGVRKMSCSTACKKASSAASLLEGGIPELFIWKGLVVG